MRSNCSISTCIYGSLEELISLLLYRPFFQCLYTCNVEKHRIRLAHIQIEWRWISDGGWGGRGSGEANEAKGRQNRRREGDEPLPPAQCLVPLPLCALALNPLSLLSNSYQMLTRRDPNPDRALPPILCSMCPSSVSSLRLPFYLLRGTGAQEHATGWISNSLYIWNS